MILYYIMFFTIFFIILDRLIESYFKYKDQTTYYLIHFLFNLGVVYETYYCIYDLLNNVELLDNYTSIPLSISLVSFQLYHSIIYYKFMRIIDWIHHTLAWFMAISIIVIYDTKGYGCLLYFFMTGAPGLLYYGPLFLLKNKIINYKTELTIQYYTNVYFRAPGINFACWSILLCYSLGHYTLPNEYKYIGILNIFISLWNAQYFTALTTQAYERMKKN